MKDWSRADLFGRTTDSAASLRLQSLQGPHPVSIQPETSVPIHRLSFHVVPAVNEMQRMIRGHHPAPVLAPGFEYPFYFVQTAPGFTGDTLGIVIPPHDSINVSFSNVDLCPICDYEVQEYFKDTLRFVFTFLDGNVYSFSKSIPISGEGYPSDVEGEDVLPSEYFLNQNYPNPFNPSTKISWQSPVSSWQTLKVYDVLGNEVATLVNEFRNAGRYEIGFNASKLSSGVYYYQLRAGSFIETKKMIYLK